MHDLLFRRVAENHRRADGHRSLHLSPFVSLLAGPFLGERIGIWRVGALCLGAAGCLLVLNPFAATFTAYQLVPVMAGFFYAWNILILRRYCRQESPLALVCIVSLMFLCSGIAGGVIMSSLPIDAGLRDQLPFLLVGWPTLGAALIATFLACPVSISSAISASAAPIRQQIAAVLHHWISPTSCS